jgi:hypothetical protein
MWDCLGRARRVGTLYRSSASHPLALSSFPPFLFFLLLFHLFRHVSSFSVGESVYCKHLLVSCALERTACHLRKKTLLALSPSLSLLSPTSPPLQHSFAFSSQLSRLSVISTTPTTCPCPSQRPLRSSTPSTTLNPSVALLPQPSLACSSGQAVWTRGVCEHLPRPSYSAADVAVLFEVLTSCPRPVSRQRRQTAYADRCYCSQTNSSAGMLWESCFPSARVCRLHRTSNALLAL